MLAPRTAPTVAGHGLGARTCPAREADRRGPRALRAPPDAALEAPAGRRRRHLADRRGRHGAHRRHDPRADGDHRRQLHGPGDDGRVRALASPRRLPDDRGGRARLPPRRDAGRRRDSAPGDLPPARRRAARSSPSATIEELGKGAVLLFVAHQVRAPRAARRDGARRRRGRGLRGLRERRLRAADLLENLDKQTVFAIIEIETLRAVLAPFGHITWTALIGGALFASTRDGRFVVTRAARPDDPRRRSRCTRCGTSPRAGP